MTKLLSERTSRLLDDADIMIPLNKGELERGGWAPAYDIDLTTFQLSSICTELPDEFSTC
jgi:hypothetical protein